MATSVTNTLVLNNNIKIGLGIYLYQHTDIKMHYGLSEMWLICFKLITLKAIWTQIINYYLISNLSRDTIKNN